MKLFILGNYRQTPGKIMKNQGERKTKTTSTIESHGFTYYIADLSGSVYIFHFSLSNTYISDPKR